MVGGVVKMPLTQVADVVPKFPIGVTLENFRNEMEKIYTGSESGTGSRVSSGPREAQKNEGLHV